MESRQGIIALYGLIAVFGILSFYVLAPFLQYVILGLCLAFLFHPLYRLLARGLPASLASTCVLFVTLLVIILPSIYLGGSLIVQATSTYQSIQARGVSIFDESSLVDYINAQVSFDISDQLADLLQEGRKIIKNAIPGILLGTGSFLLGLFLLFFVMYYALKDGASWYVHAISRLPLQPRHRTMLREKLATQASALLYGQILTTVIVGVVCAAVLWLAGFPNSVFWGFVMIILGLVPAVGAPLVYVPAGIYMFWQGGWIAGIVAIAVCGTFHFLVDNVWRPKLISTRAEIHPITVLLGAIGGIILMGAVGFLVGPLILSMFLILLDFNHATNA